MKQFIIKMGIPVLSIIMCFSALLLYLDQRKLNENDLPVAYKGRFRALSGYLHAEPSLSLRNTLASKPNSEAALEKAWKELTSLHMDSQEIAHRLEVQFPLRERLKKSGDEFVVLPGKIPGEWYSINALQISEYDPEINRLVPIENFTAYPNETFSKIRKLSDKDKELMIQELLIAYQSIAEKPFQSSASKTLRYPSFLQLKAENFYYTVPLILFSIILYAATAVLEVLSTIRKNKTLDLASFITIWLAFGIHTTIIALRCFILGRPPVSNMFETVLYVSWIVVAAGLLLHMYYRLPWVILASSAASSVLLTIAELTGLNSGLDNVQAVLDSRYWLIVHVLMVVGSYGFFVLGGILGHFYLVGYIYKGNETALLKNLAKIILQSMYIGTALLICGTILGGVWAAESWGRFWDWDPKEAWAFISSCAYLIGIHAYRFRHIGNFGLAVMAIVGLLAITFTWYGVNYILGTGLHSYGFGSGGEVYYYLFILAECLFLALVGLKRRVVV